MTRNAKQCPLFSSGKVLFSVSFCFGTQTKKLFSVSCYIGIKIGIVLKSYSFRITPQLPHSCHTVTPQLTFLCALPQQVPYKHPTSNPTSYPTSWQVRSRRAFWLLETQGEAYRQQAFRHPVPWTERPCRTREHLYMAVPWHWKRKYTCRML